MDLTQDGLRLQPNFVAGIVGLEFADIADPPDMIASAVLRDVLPLHLPSRDFFTPGDRFQYGAMRIPAAADVVHLTRSWGVEKTVKRADQVGAVHVVTYLLAFIAEYAV